MQPRTKDMPAAVNRPRKTMSNFEAKPEAPEADRGNSSNRQKVQGQTQESAREIPADEIAKRAYLHWESEGRPDGKDLDHWMRAKSELEKSRP